MDDLGRRGLIALLLSVGACALFLGGVVVGKASNAPKKPAHTVTPQTRPRAQQPVQPKTREPEGLTFETAMPALVDEAKANGWSLVFTLEGSGQDDSAYFPIRGSEQMLIWIADREDITAMINFFPPKGSPSVGGLASVEKDQDEKLMHLSEGSYYASILPFGSARWRIAILER